MNDRFRSAHRMARRSDHRRLSRSGSSLRTDAISHLFEPLLSVVHAWHESLALGNGRAGLSALPDHGEKTGVPGGARVLSVIPARAGASRTRTRVIAFGASSAPRKGPAKLDSWRWGTEVRDGRGYPNAELCVGGPGPTPHHRSASPFPVPSISPPVGRPGTLPASAGMTPGLAFAGPRLPRGRGKAGARWGPITPPRGTGYAVVHVPAPVGADAALVGHLPARPILLIALRCQPLAAMRPMVLTPCC